MEMQGKSSLFLYFWGRIWKKEEINFRFRLLFFLFSVKMGWKVVKSGLQWWTSGSK